MRPRPVSRRAPFHAPPRFTPRPVSRRAPFHAPHCFTFRPNVSQALVDKGFEVPVSADKPSMFAEDTLNEARATIEQVKNDRAIAIALSKVRLATPPRHPAPRDAPMPCRSSVSDDRLHRRSLTHLRPAAATPLPRRCHAAATAHISPCALWQEEKAKGTGTEPLMFKPIERSSADTSISAGAIDDWLKVPAEVEEPVEDTPAAEKPKKKAKKTAAKKRARKVR